MKYDLFKEKILRHLSVYKNNVLGIDESGVWTPNEQKYLHILPQKYKMLNVLPTAKMPEIEEHRFIHHLNSSQMMCINFFQPLFNDSEGESILLNLLSQAMGISCPVPEKIDYRKFEYRPCEKERTSFDLYIKLSGDIEIYFEIKYTENCFGKTGSTKDNSNKYTDKWVDIYSAHNKNSLYLQNIKQDDFYRDYQIWRNISYVRNENNYAVFVIPHQNENLITELSRTVGFHGEKKFNNVKIVYWSDLTSSALELSRNTKYHQHFKLFNDKYMVKMED